MKVTIPSAEQMERLGAVVMHHLSPGEWVYLNGDLGTGKTTLVRGALRALGYQEAVKSPTFTLVEQYDFDLFEVFHFDFYRVKNPEELELMGLRDYFTPHDIGFVEWPQIAGDMLPPPAIQLALTHEGDKRMVDIEASQAMDIYRSYLK